MQRHDERDTPQPADPDPRFGDEQMGTPAAEGLARLVKLDLILTAVFVVSAVVSAIAFNDVTRVIGVVVALVLFGVGVFAFLIGYFVAVGRSRTEEMGVAELYLLTSAALPKPARRALLWALGIQIVTALATALARPSTDGRAGSTLAFGVLVPMLGLGINGLASARYGRFGPRRRRSDPEPGADPETPDDIGDVTSPIDHMD